MAIDVSQLEYLKGLESVFRGGFEDDLIQTLDGNNIEGLKSLFQKVTIGTIVSNGLANKIADEQINVIKI